MALTIEQKVEANVRAMQRQGASAEAIENYLGSLRGQESQSAATTFRRNDTQNKSAITGVAEFLFPSTTSLITGIKSGEGFSARQAIGAALEVGSTIIPAGAAVRGGLLAARGVGALARGGRAAIGIARGTGARPVTSSQVANIPQFLGRAAGRVPGSVRRGAQLGGVSGAGFGAAQQVSDPEAGLGDVLKGAAGGAVAGAATGAIIAPVGGLASLTGKQLAEWGAQGLVKMDKILRPVGIEIVDEVSGALRQNYIKGNTSMISGFERILKSERGTGGPNDIDGLLKEYVSAGFIPKFETSLGSLIGRQGDNLKVIASKKKNLSQGLNKYLDNVTDTTDFASLQSRAVQLMKERGTWTENSVRELGLHMQNIKRNAAARAGETPKRLTTTANAKEVNAIRAMMSDVSEHQFGKFSFDAADALRAATRERLGQITPGDIANRLNAEIGRYERIQKVAQLLDNKKTELGDPILEVLGRAMGISVLSKPIQTGIQAGGTILGFGGGATGMGLLAAYFASSMGARTLRQFLIGKRFNPEVQQKLRETINADQEMLRRILQEATPEDARLLREALEITAPR